MARKGHGRPADLVNLSSHPDDGSSPVGSNEWNKNRDTTGIMGFTKKTEAIDGSNNINITDSYVEVTNAGTIHTMSQVTTALSTTYYPSDTTTKSFAEGDLLYIVKASGVGTVNLNHQQGGAGAGKITTLSGNTQTLDEKVPRIFMCRTIGSNQEWVEYGGGSASDLDTTNFAASALVVESVGIGSNDNDTTIPTSAAIKDYVDTQVATVPTGDITGVTAGTALTGGGTSGGVTVNADVGIGDDKLLQANANVADDDFLRIDGTKVEGRTAAQVKSDLDLEIGTDVQAYNANTALTTNKISDFASSTSAELASKITGETGSGALVFGTAPTITLANGTGLVATTGLTATGTKNSTTFLCGDDTWKTAGGGDEAKTVLKASGYSAANQSPSTEGTHKVSIFTKTIDSNNQGLYVRVKKNGAYEDVQIG